MQQDDTSHAPGFRRDPCARGVHSGAGKTGTALPFRPLAVHGSPLTQAVLDALSAPAVILDEQGSIIAANSAWRHAGPSMTEPEAAGVGANYLKVCDAACGANAEKAQAMARGVRDVLSGARDEYQLGSPCPGPHGQRWYLARVTSAPVGAARFAVVVYEDVTAAAQARARQDGLSAELEREVVLRTQALQAANDELDAFAASVSHDLRTPVRHIQGFLGLLRDKLDEAVLGERERRLLVMLDHAAARLNVMIDELLALSRVTRRDMRFAPVALRASLQDAWSDLEPDWAERAVDFDLGELPVVWGDAELLRFAFENLLSNALKYTSRRAVARVEVRAQRVGGEWVVCVRDNGVGFDARYTERLFGAFQRLHRDGEFAGVGMGLANVKRIVARHGGRVWAEGRLGEGAAFFVALPVLGDLPAQSPPRSAQPK